MARKKMAVSKKRPSEDPSFRKLKPAYYPVQLKNQLAPNTAGPYAPAPWFHDTARALSEVNHRLHRRGRCYTLKIDIDNDASVEGNKIDVYALVNTWWVANAFAAARGAYETAVAEERAAVGQEGRWNDFIPDNGFASQHVGAALADSTFTSLGRDDGEHTVTLVNDVAGNTRFFTWGPSSSSSQFSIVREYDDMGRSAISPEGTGSLGGYIELNEEIIAQDITRIQNDGNAPPYNSQSTIGTGANYLVKIATLELAGSGSKRLSTGFFEAPCGYVWFDGVGATFPTGKITVTVKSGDYKGTHAPSMAE